MTCVCIFFHCNSILFVVMLVFSFFPIYLSLHISLLHVLSCSFTLKFTFLRYLFIVHCMFCTVKNALCCAWELSPAEWASCISLTYCHEGQFTRPFAQQNWFLIFFCAASRISCLCPYTRCMHCKLHAVFLILFYFSSTDGHKHWCSRPGTPATVTNKYLENSTAICY